MSHSNPSDASDGFQALVEHYRATRRDLPWRGTRDPYAILVSEIMLQQTRVETVIPYYRRFLARFPTAGDLAAAPEQEVLAAWAGLGYYRRARLLQEAARALAQRDCPRTLEGLRALPGVGEYTAAALASIAFDQPAVALDGNALRVLSRYHGVADPPRRATRARLTELTRPHIPPGAAGDFTQAVMELGARVCLPRPLCPSCPLQPGCAAHLQGRTGEIPPPRASRPSLEVHRLVARLEQAGRTLLVREPEAPFLATMWQCPYLEYTGEPPAGSWVEQLGPLEELGQVRQGITYRRLKMRVVRARELRAPLPWAQQRWVDLSDLGGLPVPAFVRRIYLLGMS